MANENSKQRRSGKSIRSVAVHLIEIDFDPRPRFTFTRYQRAPLYTTLSHPILLPLPSFYLHNLPYNATILNKEYNDIVRAQEHFIFNRMVGTHRSCRSYFHFV